MSQEEFTVTEPTKEELNGIHETLYLKLQATPITDRYMTNEEYMQLGFIMLTTGQVKRFTLRDGKKMLFYYDSIIAIEKQVF